MADPKAGRPSDGAAAAADGGESGDQRTGRSQADQGNGRGRQKGKGRKRGDRRHGDTGTTGKGRKRKQRKRGKRPGRNLEVRPLAVLTALAGMAAALVVGFISGRSSGRR